MTATQTRPNRAATILWLSRHAEPLTPSGAPCAHPIGERPLFAVPSKSTPALIYQVSVHRSALARCHCQCFAGEAACCARIPLALRSIEIGMLRAFDAYPVLCGDAPLRAGMNGGDE